MNQKNRYDRQILLQPIRERGQKKLLESNIVIIGCGALGSHIADNLVRSGIGHITLVDRDLVELTNLQRQTLFDEDDIGLPKAIVAAEKLRKINSDIKIIPIVDDVNNTNIESIIQNNDVVLDGLDNMLTRLLINDACVKNHIPWIYGGAIETYGLTMNIVPGQTACLRCIMPDLPKPGLLPTCDTIGVLNCIPSIIASIEAAEAIKIILNDKQKNEKLISYDMWSHKFNAITINRRDNCECCVNKRFEYLISGRKERVISLCGSNAVQISPIEICSVSFKKLENKLSKVGDVEYNETVFKFTIPDYEINIFGNGRAIIYGTTNAMIAKSLYARYIGI